MKKKILVASFPILIAGIIFLVGFNTKTKEEQKENNKIVDTENLLSYTIDGNPATEKPTKESGYLANSIKCDNGSILVWDNDNWKVELVEPKGNDRCVVDFTKNTSASGYRITATSTLEGALDSYSKATTNGGRVEIYTKYGITIKGISGCTGIVENNKAVITNVTQNQTCNIEIEPSLANYVKLAYPSSGARSSFSSIYTTTALHTATDYDSNGNFNGTTYYFTGNPNNWVSFAGKKWRIIRINGDGSVRLLYAGSGSTDGYINNTTYQYNSSSNNPAYVGWKYGTSGQNGRGTTASPIYNTVSSWYTTNITNAGLGNYIETNAVYCNDRTASTSSTNDTSYTTFTAADNLGTTYYYGGYKRLYNKGTPTLECNASDQFKDGFGLMTADEVAYAGGVYGASNSSAYYYLNASGGSSTGSNWWWTMSPYRWNGSNARVFIVYGSGSYPGQLNYNYVGNSYVVRPVVSLKSSVLVTDGNGTGSSPYTLTL